MTVYVVVEHDPYKYDAWEHSGFSDHVIAICATLERAQEIADGYKTHYALYWYSVERCEVTE